jgi:hypothetical protein
MQFQVIFKDSPPLLCQINSTDLGQRYYNLVRNQWKDDPQAIFRDPQKYTLEYFTQLVDQAHTQLSWNWKNSHYDLATTTRLHKDLEEYLADGFENIPIEYDMLLHELHFALHAIESGSRRNNWLQIEWYNDRGFAITQDEYPAKINLEFGDLRLQNPHVGHHPLFLYQQQDNINILQTCRFHDFVKPGINLVIERESFVPFDWDRYINWFHTNGPDFVEKYSESSLIKFTGHPVIGRVINTNDLATVINKPYLEFESLEF